MKKTIRFVLILLLSTLSGTAFSQKIDWKKMDQDLNIAETTLYTLTQNTGVNTYLARKLNGNYYPEYGVVFSYVVRDGFSSECSPCDENDKQRLIERNKRRLQKSDSIFKDMTVRFLLKYVGLINQLSPDDKVTIIAKSIKNKPSWVDSSTKKEVFPIRTAQLYIKDILLYKKGEATYDITAKKIKYGAITSKKLPGLEVFKNVLHQLYPRSRDHYFYISSNDSPRYTHLPGFGVVLYSNLYTNQYNYVPQNPRLTYKEKYTALVHSLKENLLEYGKNIEGLEPDQILLLDITIPGSYDVNSKKRIKIYISSDDLVSYRQRTLNKEKAMEKIIVID